MSHTLNFNAINLSHIDEAGGTVTAYKQFFEEN